MINILMLISFLSLNVFAESDRKLQRYLAGYDLISVLAQKFPDWKRNEGSLSKDCRFLVGGSLDSLGIASPDSGTAMHDRPSPSMVRWLHSCGKAYIQVDIDSNQSSAWSKRILPQLILEKYHLDQESDRKTWLSQTWVSLSDDEQKSMGRQIIKYLIGPESSLDNEQILKSLNPYLKLKTRVAAIQDILLAVLMTDEFLSY